MEISFWVLIMVKHYNNIKSMINLQKCTNQHTLYKLQVFEREFLIEIKYHIFLVEETIIGVSEGER